MGKTLALFCYQVNYFSVFSFSNSSEMIVERSYIEIQSWSPDNRFNFSSVVTRVGFDRCCSLFSLMYSHTSATMSFFGRGAFPIIAARVGVGVMSFLEYT